MAVCSQVKLSETIRLRLDPEYYQPYYLDLVAKLTASNPEPIDDFAYVTDGIHLSPDWAEKGITYLSAKNVKDNYITLADAGKISQKQNDLNPRTQLRRGDVLLTTVGTIGNAAVVSEKILPANIDRHVGVIRIRGDVDPYYLATFLNSEFGRFQALRESTGNVQLNLFIDKIKRILVPTGDRFNDVGKIARRAYDLRFESEALYVEIEALLLHELGFHMQDISSPPFCTAMLSEAMVARRWDAEYWSDNYRTLISNLKRRSYKTLSELASFSNGATPRGANYSNSGIPFLRIQNIDKNKLELDDVVYIDKEINNKLLGRSQLNPGDVLITITGRIGTSAVVPADMLTGNINQHIVRLRLKDSGISPYYLSVFLNSPVGRLQAEREAYGTTREALPYYCLERIVVPEASQSLQEEIEIKLKAAELSLRKSKILLKAAKNSIEQMILCEE